MRQEEQYLLQIVNDSSLILWTIDRNGLYTHCNGQALSYFGYKPKDLIGKNIFEVFKGYPRAVSEIKRALSGEKFATEFRMADKWFMHVFTPLHDNKGKIKGLTGLSIDITEKHKISKTHEKLFKLSLDLICFGSLDGQIVEINPALKETLGYETEEMTESPFSEYIHPEDLTATNEAFARLKAGEKLIQFDNRVRHKDGSYRTLEWTADAIREENIFYAIARDVTERKLYEDKIQASEIKFRQLADSLPQLIWSVTPDGKVDYNNKRWHEFTGLQTGQDWKSIVHPDDLKVSLKKWGLSFSSGQAYQMEMRYWDKEHNTYRWFLERAIPIKDSKGQIEKWIGSSTDINDKKNSEEILIDQKEDLQCIIETIPQLIWSSNAEGEVDFLSKRFLNYLNRTDKELLGWGWTDLIHPDDKEKVITEWRKCLNEKVPYSMEYRILRRDGNYYWLLSLANPLLDSKGNLVKYYGTCTDIELEKRNEMAIKKTSQFLEEKIQERTEELTSSRAFLNSLIENLPNMIFVKDAKNLRFVRFNKAGEDLLGHKKEDLIGKNDYDFFPKDQADFFTSKDRDVLRGHEIVDIPEEKIQTQMGLRILHTKKIPLYDKEGKAEYLLGISEDITERKKSEYEKLDLMREQTILREREKQARAKAFLSEATNILASSLDYHSSLQKLMKLLIPEFADWGGATVLTRDGRWEHVIKIHKDPNKLHLLEELSRIEDRPRSIDYLQGANEAVHISKVAKEDIKRKITSLRGQSLIDKLGVSSLLIIPIIFRKKILGTLTLLISDESRDFSKEKINLLEELGRRIGSSIDNAFLYEAAQDAIKSRDDFISIASHELKTPISSLKLQMQMTKRSIHLDSGITPSAEKLTKIIDSSTMQIDRLTALVDDLLDVSRIESGNLRYNFERIDISHLVCEMVDRYKDHLTAIGTPIICKTSGPAFIKADRFRFEQVMINLLTNAGKYGGKKPVNVTVQSCSKKAIIKVTDHGIGIAKEKLQKIFERFERAEESGKIEGLGLGLYISKEIIKAHHGNIFVESTPGRGTTFCVEVPLWQETLS